MCGRCTPGFGGLGAFGESGRCDGTRVSRSYGGTVRCFARVVSPVVSERFCMGVSLPMSRDFVEGICFRNNVGDGRGVCACPFRLGCRCVESGVRSRAKMFKRTGSVLNNFLSSGPSVCCFDFGSFAVDGRCVLSFNDRCLIVSSGDPCCLARGRVESAIRTGGVGSPTMGDTLVRGSVRCVGGFGSFVESRVTRSTVGGVTSFGRSRGPSGDFVRTLSGTGRGTPSVGVRLSRLDNLGRFELGPGCAA